MSVQEYIEKHDLTKKIEEALNAAVKAKADEPLAFVVRATRRD
jgi:enolase